LKYNHITPQQLKCFKLPKLNGGTDINGQDLNCLLKSQNLWFKDGRLKTRPGIFAKGESAHTVPKNSYYDEFDYRIHDVTVNYLDTDYKIATIGVNSDDFMYTLYIYFVASEYNILSVGSLQFLRLSSDSYKIPENINFYTGKAQTGGGIFALISLKNVEKPNDKNYNFYEINSEFNEWQRVYDFYVPTVLINGRGNNYDIAYAEGLVDYQSPKTLESQNLLNGRFYAYYTSDGRSNVFRLPVTELSFDSVVCRINYTTSLYCEWVISGQSIVDTQSFMGSDIMLEVDREKGTLSFRRAGEAYAIPIMPTYNENNIKITATKETNDGFAQVVDSTCSLAADGRIYLSGGKNGNILMLAKTENPLYFPQKSTTDVGGMEPITALSIQNKKIIALKKSESYFVTLRKGDRINEIGLLADNDKLFKSADTLTPELISKAVGCEFKNTVCKIGDKTVWLGQDCEVYVLDSIGFDSVRRLSGSLKADSSYEYMDSFAVSDGSYYILSAGNKAFVCELCDFKNPKWYMWKFGKGDTLCGGFYRNGNLWFLCNAQNSGIFYIASLSGESDIEMYYDEDGNIEACPIKIEGFFETPYYAFSGMNQKNMIESVYIAVSGKGRVEIKVNNRSLALVDLRYSTDDYDKGEYKTVMLKPHLYDTERFKLYISSDCDFAVGDIEIFYRKMG